MQINFALLLVKKGIGIEKMKEKQVIVYHDELNDEFSTAQITPKKIDGNYRYIYTGWFKKFTHFFWYRMIATPIAFLYCQFKFHHKTKNRALLKKASKTGYFLFGNHTQPTGDAFMPSMIAYPKHVYVIVHPNNVSMPVLGKITPSLGALPLPDDIEATKNFIHAIETRIKEKRAVVVYPEAHIWPYYTKIRPFMDTSFRYPIKYKVPTFSFTNTYQKRKFSKKPKIITYIDGPFYPNEDLSASEQKKDLRDRVYRTMTKRSELSNVEVIQYVKGETKND